MAVHGWVKRATVDWKRIVAPHAIRSPIGNLRILLAAEECADGNTKDRFEAWARGDGRDIRFEADTRIASEMKGGWVPDYNDLDLYDIQDEAEGMAAERPDLAEIIYAGLTESLAIHIEGIDDSCGTFWPMFEECMESMGRCIERQNLDAAGRRNRIEYLSSWSLVAFTDFMKYYEKEIVKLCLDAEDCGAWARVLGAELRQPDIEDRRCSWAAHKSTIEETLERVKEMSKEADGR